MGVSWSQKAGEPNRYRITDETPKSGERQQVEADRQTARTKLLALAGDVADLKLRHRLLESSPDRRPLLRVWDPQRQALGETIVCLRTEDQGWQFAAHPFGPVLSSAEGVEMPGDAIEAAQKVAERLERHGSRLM